MKKLLLILGIFFSLFLCVGIDTSFAGNINIPGAGSIKNASLDIAGNTGTVGAINNIGFDILKIVKRVIMGLLVIYMVYAGAMMIISMGSNEEQLSASKRQIWYALVALVFVNIPGTLYNAFFSRNVNGSRTVGGDTGGTFDSTVVSDNLFFNFGIFTGTVNNQIVMFLEIMIFIAALFMITLAGINLLTARGKEEKMSEAKNKIVYTILALVFVGIIEAWKSVAFGGVISDGIDLFESLANLALFFAAPVAIFFLSLAGYYYITSNGDEERVKKAKSIITNTVFATLILLMAYTFLLDFVTFT